MSMFEELDKFTKQWVTLLGNHIKYILRYENIYSKRL